MHILTTASTWLLTPVLSIGRGTTLTFWTRTVSNVIFPDRLQVRLSTNGASTDVGSNATSVGDFSTLMLEINPDQTFTGYPTSWTPFTVTVLTGPQSFSGRFAFRYFVTNAGPSGTNSDYVGIDSCTVAYTEAAAGTE